MLVELSLMFREQLKGLGGKVVSVECTWEGNQRLPFCLEQKEEAEEKEQKGVRFQRAGVPVCLPLHAW